MRSTRSLLGRLGLLAVALAGALSLIGAAGSTPAHALCITPPVTDQHGSWRNLDASTRSVTRVRVNNVCSDLRLCDQNGVCTWNGGYFVRVFGKCHPYDCDWGEVKATPMSDGWILATYTRSWATKYVWLKTYGSGPLVRLRVYVRTDFTDADGRTDYTTDEWFVRT
jgi:hypothetical protein